MSKHTPGPWRYWACKVDSRANPPMYDYAQFANPNGHVFRAPLRYMREEDARLIAAAPDLLEALVMVRDADETRTASATVCRLSRLRLAPRSTPPSPKRRSHESIKRNAPCFNGADV